MAKTIDLRNSCEPWIHIPANDILNSPPAALLECADDAGVWLAVQLICFADTAEIEMRYKPSFPTVAPIPQIQLTNTQETEPLDVSINTKQEDIQSEISPDFPPLLEQEMLFFNFPKIGFTNVMQYDFASYDWSYREKHPNSPFFRQLYARNHADTLLMATGITERLPLKGSRKAIAPVVEACRVAKKNLANKITSQNTD